jgi:flagellar assembly protein FliH
MSDPVAAKSGLTAWQRWELPSFDAPPPPTEPAVEEEPIRLPTAEQLENIHVLAHQEGYEAGHAEGYQVGYAEAAKQAREEAERLAGLMASLEGSLREADQVLAQEVLDFALEVARQMLHQALEAKPELVLGVVREAINTLPHFGQSAHLVLNPTDAELVRSHMGDQLAHTGWKILEDARIERGGCRVETSQSQIDASLATRWQRVVASLGSDSQWIQP